VGLEEGVGEVECLRKYGSRIRGYAPVCRHPTSNPRVPEVAVVMALRRRFLGPEMSGERCENGRWGTVKRTTRGNEDEDGNRRDLPFNMFSRFVQVR
jgi:hypothetical protein